MKPAIFLDRDGTLISEVNFLHKPEQVKLIPGIGKAIAKANSRNIPVYVVSNQSGVARGLFSESDVHVVHSHIDSLLSTENAKINAWFFCPHYPLNNQSAYDRQCECRKPGTGMFREAEKSAPIYWNSSLMVGDKLMDIQAGRKLNMICALVETGYGSQPDVQNELNPDEYVFVNSAAAVEWYLTNY